jgi:hypothetical protein
MISSYNTTDDQEHLSIEYKNLYYISGSLYYLTTDPNVHLPHVFKFLSHYTWIPEIKVFESNEKIEEYLNTFISKEEVELCAYGDTLWYGSAGHALWDGLYPLYLALVKFGYENSPFTLLTTEWINKKIITYKGINAFCGNNLMEFPFLNQDTLIHFKTLVAGTGRAGSTIINPEYEMYGKKYNGVALYKNRMLNSHQIQIDKPINDTPKVAIINNKRYTSSEINVLNQIIECFKDICNITLIDWGNYNSFEEQLKELEDIDIHISGPGTGIVYMPFLKKGAVNINLGYMEHSQTNTMRENIKIPNYPYSDWIFPGWMEQPMHAAAYYVSTLYYDRFKYNDIEFEPLKNLIENAILLLKDKKILENNHNIDAQVYVEYCKKVTNGKQISDMLTGKALYIEQFVNEHPFTVPRNLVNIDLLRQIKDELKYDRKYECKVQPN